MDVTSNNQALVFAISLVILLFSVVVHEVMHGLAALYFGDRTALHAGRLTLNPIPHIDPIGSILLPVIFIASSFLIPGGSGAFIVWAKPVPVNPYHFSHLKLGEFVVSAAGIVANIGLAALAALIFHIFGGFYYPTLVNILSFMILINLTLAAFNLLPIPPLDGSKILASLLPPHLEYQYRSLERYGFFILIILLFSPLGGVLWIFIRAFVNFFRALFGV